MYRWCVLVCSALFLWSCFGKKNDKDNPILGDELVTFIVKGLPESHDFNNDLFISGNFEGWSGGRNLFKLKKLRNQYQITVPKYKEHISFKFTKGDWNSVECASDGNPIENRVYSFNKLNDTVNIHIVNWQDSGHVNSSTAAANVTVFAENYNIPQLKRTRKITVYLPPNYESSTNYYPVLYLQDGQNVFDIKTSYSGEWEVDETLNKLYEKLGFGLIVVAVDHGNDKRLSEYAPWDAERHGKGEAKGYLDFLVNTLKSEIDHTFRTKSNPENTAIIGASMGGLFAHYAAFERPGVFGKSAVFSPSFWYFNQVYDFTTKRAHAANKSKVYLLGGGKESSDMETHVTKMYTLLINQGFNRQNLKMKITPEGTHSESFWKNEFETAIKWLFNMPETTMTFKPYRGINVSNGSLMRLEGYTSKYIVSRPVDVWLPENYSEDKKYAVLYMHDGQMLFDPASTWNKQAWKVDKVATKLLNKGVVKDFIIVGIHNIKNLRWQDLFPQKVFKNLSPDIQKKALALKADPNSDKALHGDNYLRFIVQELKPLVDEQFSTYTNLENTFVAGSSMGGLMSMYAICEYPNVFGAAACLSTHWPGVVPVSDTFSTVPHAILNYMETHLPNPKTHRLYFDYGTETLDKHYLQYALQVENILKPNGYTKPQYENFKFQGADHTESAWNKRLHIPLTYLLKK
ncbi:alpha/beta hydrolase [Tamlana fucoidanivorans]|uniref:Alpha/beta hydrolase n=1 Tax=Allotamlana fucoidanivorans TaxID=2583814 RepID=A0A5C4SM97_9FLAO|nr:alpha/beta hydrolase-fold protein [Tamlana fucoidanivorans]TNJ45206.1 alpha/beta hydrolase [Tamlana fucoidanivorans]